MLIIGATLIVIVLVLPEGITGGLVKLLTKKKASGTREAESC
jgi:hypothetical protein